VFDNVGEGVAVLDVEGRFVDMNVAMATVLGIEEPDLLVGTAMSAIPLVDRSLAPIPVHPVSTAISTDEAIGPLIVGIETTTGFRWIEGTFVPLKRFGEQPYGALVSLHDVTEQLAVLDALAASEARFRNLTAISPVGIFETDLEGSCVYVNGKWMELTGLTMEQARGDGWSAGVHPDDRDCVFSQWAACMASQEPFVAAFRYTGGSGGTVPVHVEARIIHDASGVPTGWLGTATDLRTQAALRAALAESEARFRELAERSPDVIARITFDPVRFDYVSPAITAVNGLTPQDCYDDPAALWRAIHPDDAERVHRLLLGPEPAAQLEFRVVHRDGSVRTLDVRAAAIHRDGRVVGLDTTARDVTDAAALRDRLADLAHRDPLTGLMNRRALKAALAERLAAATPTAVLFIDLDGFKVVNDRFGHDAGDAVLTRSASDSWHPCAKATTWPASPGTSS
jgi:PAS domain S-box-containing protein